MSSYKIKTYKFICDSCHKEVVVQSRWKELPEGWEQHFEYDFKFDYCEECIKEKQ